MAVFGRTPAEGNTWKPRALGIASVRKGRRPVKVVNPGEAESVQVGTIPKREGARECDRPMGHFTDAGPKAKGPVCSAPSLRSIFTFEGP